MWEISIWFVAILFAINGMLIWVTDAVADYDLISPFNNQTYTPPALQNVNSTIGNLTTLSSATNSTGGSPVPIWDAANFIYNGGVFFVQFLYGSVTGSFFITMGLPQQFLAILYGLELFFLGITTLHIFTGRF